MTTKKFENRATCVLVIECVNSNLNGDPDCGGAPRIMSDEKGYVTDVSIKRKARDLVSYKEGPIWDFLEEKYKLNPDEFGIHVDRNCNNEALVKDMQNGTFQSKYWDARAFGNTVLSEIKDEKGKKDSGKNIRSGAIQVAIGDSIAPVEIIESTMTCKRPVEDGSEATRGMAPLALKFVRHGVYVVVIEVNPTEVSKSGCTAADINVFKSVLPYIFTHTVSHTRPSVHIRHAWWAEHKSPRGSFKTCDFVEALTPVKKGDPAIASTSWKDYEDRIELPEDLRTRMKTFEDLTEVED